MTHIKITSVGTVGIKSYSPYENEVISYTGPSKLGENREAQPQWRI